MGDERNENNPASARGDIMNDDQDLDFSLALKKRGLEIREQEGDGNCLFRAVSLQVYGDPSMHGDVRKQCMDFMVSVRAVVLTGSPQQAFQF
jgi:OTU domain-containing protein 5